MSNRKKVNRNICYRCHQPRRVVGRLIRLSGEKGRLHLCPPCLESMSQYVQAKGVADA